MIIKEGRILSDDERIAVDWEELGEGWCGEYDPEDPEDTELLRFDVMVKEFGEDEFSYLDNGSFCTRFPVNAPEPVKQAGLLLIFQRLEPLVREYLVNGDRRYKREAEELSWIEPSWVTPKGTVIV